MVINNKSVKQCRDPLEDHQPSTLAQPNFIYFLVVLVFFFSLTVGFETDKIRCHLPLGWFGSSNSLFAERKQELVERWREADIGYLHIFTWDLSVATQRFRVFLCAGENTSDTVIKRYLGFGNLCAQQKWKFKGLRALTTYFSHAFLSTSGFINIF